MKPSDIQSLIERRLRAFPAFAGLNIILERDGNIPTRIKTALATAGGGGSRPGLALIIGTASAQIRTIQAARLVIDPLAVALTVIENDLFNRPPAGTGQRAGDLALQAAAALLGWTPDGCGRPLAPPGGNNVSEADDGKGGAAASVTLTTSLELPVLRLPGEYGYNAPA